MFSWIRTLRRPHVQRPARKYVSRRLQLETLETRSLMSANISVFQTNLVSDLPNVATSTDPRLVNPWGLTTGGVFWISDNNAGLSTTYKADGTVLAKPFASIPTPGDPTGATGAPTGVVFNSDAGSPKGFVVTNGTQSGAAIFIFDTEDGTIVGWNPGVNPVGSDPAKAGTFGTIAVDNSNNGAPDGAVYKGLAIASSPAVKGAPTADILAGQANTTSLLYAANFRSGHVDVFGTDFKPVTLSAGAFTDPNLPKGFAPFNVADLNGKIYVTYAKQNLSKHDDVAGAGLGVVDVYNLDGTGEQRLVSNGPHSALNSPWGLAIAPSSFGALSGSLLVGNFGDGTIHAYNATTGKFMGQLVDPAGVPIQIDGLWSLEPASGSNPPGTLYFTAGLDGETHGVFGSFTPVAPGTPVGNAQNNILESTIVVDQANFQNSLTTLQNDIAGGADNKTIRQDIRDVNQALTALNQAETALRDHILADLGLSKHDGGGSGHRHHGHGDGDGDGDDLDGHR